MFQSPFQQGSPFKNPFQQNFINKEPAQEPQHQPSKMPRFMNYVADYGGGGFWRVLWPEYLLNASNKCMVHTSTMMTMDPNHYRNAVSIKLQRQASPDQLGFCRYLKDISQRPELGFRLIYEIDDLAF